MLVRCSWCEKEGCFEVLREVEGPADAVTHTICDEHQKKLLKKFFTKEGSRKKGEKNPKRRGRRRRKK